jgi:hypothetical protein
MIHDRLRRKVHEQRGVARMLSVRDGRGRAGFSLHGRRQITSGVKQNWDFALEVIEEARDGHYQA